jgi:hypothetical protein
VRILILNSFCINLEYYLWKLTTISCFTAKILTFAKFLIKITCFVGTNRCFPYIRRGKKCLDDFSENLKAIAELSDVGGRGPNSRGGGLLKGPIRSDCIVPWSVPMSVRLCLSA